MERKPVVIFVGSFVDPLTHKERGGMQVDCGHLMDSALARRIAFVPLDSTNPRLPLPPLWVRSWLACRRFFRFIGMLLLPPDAVLIYASGGLSAIEKGLMCLAARLRGIPSILSIRSGIFMSQIRDIPSYKSLNSVLLSSSDCLLCQGDSWRDFYEQEYPSLHTKVLVLKNWIEPSPYKAHYLRRIEIAKNTQVRLLFVGWVKRSKGVYELVSAFREARRSANIHLDFVGGGDDFDAISMSVNEMKIKELVDMHGWQRGGALTQLYQKADIFVLPTYAEGFPNVILEAMASGLPIITTPVGAIPDVVKQGVHGFLVPPRDSSALAGAIITLANDRQLRERMGAENVKEIERNHTVAVLTEELGVNIMRLVRNNIRVI